ncbi:MAG: ComF family protein [Devosiaceae bacterium]|nr:ComF family protein [Devosiaceae bacterium MH13]
MASLEPTREKAGLRSVLAGYRRSSLSSVTRAFTKAVDFAVPPTCPSCHDMVQMDGGLCGACWRQVPWIEEPVCDRLGLPLAYDLGPGAVSAEALANPPAFDRMRAVCTHEGVAPRLVHALKFGRQRHLAGSLGAMMARAGRSLLEREGTVLVPVPLHPLRRFGRRYNQSALLAETVGHVTGAPVAHRVVRRTKATRQQISLSRGERLRNLKGAFAVTDQGKASLAGRHVVLVDDVHTTGATLNALASTLRALPRDARPQSVDALVFSCALLPGAPDAL